MDCRNDDADARKCYAKALELDEKFDMAYYNRGWTFAKGAKDYDRALAIDGSYDEAHAARAQALSRLNRIHEALEAIGKAVKTATYKPERFEKIRERIKAMKSESPSRAGR